MSRLVPPLVSSHHPVMDEWPTRIAVRYTTKKIEAIKETNTYETPRGAKKENLIFLNHLTEAMTMIIINVEIT